MWWSPLDHESIRQVVMIFAVIVIIFPLALLKNLSGLRFVALMAVMTLFYITVVVVVEFPDYLAENHLDDMKYLNFDSNFFTAFSL